MNETAIPGGEELYSHRDAVEFAATVDAADQAFSVIEPLCRLVAPSLTQTVATRFAQLQASGGRVGHSRRRHTDASLPPDTRLALSQRVDATATPLAELAAILVPFGTAGPPS